MCDLHFGQIKLETIAVKLPTTHNDEFNRRSVLQWRVGDVCDYLRSLSLTDEQVSAFHAAAIDGPQLAQYYNDRKLMTKLGMSSFRSPQT